MLNFQITERQKLLLLSLKKNKNLSLDSIQLQKVLFLIDRELLEKKYKKVFDFIPYNYGPFDREVYKDIEILAQNDLIEDRWENSSKRIYKYIENKLEIGEDALNAKYGSSFSENVGLISNFVSNLSFDELLSWLYNRHKDMAINTIYKNKKIV